jgi:hypothetical protein
VTPCGATTGAGSADDGSTGASGRLAGGTGGAAAGAVVNAVAATEATTDAGAVANVDGVTTVSSEAASSASALALRLSADAVELAGDVRPASPPNPLRAGPDAVALGELAEVAALAVPVALIRSVLLTRTVDCSAV